MTMTAAVTGSSDRTHACPDFREEIFDNSFLMIFDAYALRVTLEHETYDSKAD